MNPEDAPVICAPCRYGLHAGCLGALAWCEDVCLDGHPLWLHLNPKG